MNKSYNVIKDIIESRKYKVLEDNGNNILIRYQMNNIHICPDKEDDTFVSILLPNFDKVDEENFSEVVMRCHRLNEKAKQIKFYTANEVLIAASEFYYMGKEDLGFQIKQALSNLIEAKLIYCNYEN